MLSPLALALLLQVPPSASPPPPHSPTPIRLWLVTAPVPTDTGPERLTRDYLGGERTAFPDSDAAWRPIAAGDDGLVDIGSLAHRSTDNVVSYAFTYIEMPRDETALLILASRDDVAAWLNGQRIHARPAVRDAAAQRDTVIVRLAAGWNALLLKVVNRTGRFGFGAWLLTGGSRARLSSANHRPAAANGFALPGATVTAGPVTVTAPPVWRGSSLDVKGTIALTAWGPAAIAAATVQLISAGDTLIRTVVQSLVPGTPRELRLEMNLADLADAAAATEPPHLQVLWRTPGQAAAEGAARGVALPVLSAERIIAPLDGRIDLDWSGEETAVEIPSALAGLGLDLVTGTGSRQVSVNGAAKPVRNGVATVCAPGACVPGDSLVIRLDAMPAGDPYVRVKDRTYTDIATNLALLPALADSSTIPPPDARAWLAAMLRADKTSYRRLAAQYDALLAPQKTRFSRDTIDFVGVARARGDGVWRAALALGARVPGATFAAGTAERLADLEERAPQLLDSIRTAVERGKWSVVGGWWSDADPSALGGESLVRQGLYGQAYFQRRLGRRAQVGWGGPDAAAFPQTLPQIWRGLGLNVLVAPGEALPKDGFFWEGLDGTRIFAYRLLESDGSGEDLARQTARGSHRLMVAYAVSDALRATAELLERRDDLRRLPAFPTVRDATLEEALRGVRAARPDATWPVWRGDVAPTAERRPAAATETLLLTAEVLAALDRGGPYPRAELRRAWERLLSNDADDAAAATATAVRDAAFGGLAGALDTRDQGGIPVVVFNPDAWVRTSYATVRADAALAAVRGQGTLRAVDAARRATPAVLTGDSLRFLAREVPALGFKVFWIRPGAAPGGTLTGTATRLENEYIVAEVDSASRIHVRDKRTGREVATLDSVGVIRAGGDGVERWIESARLRLTLRRDEPLLEIRGTASGLHWGVPTDSTVHEIAYGALARATEELPRQRWADRSDATLGVSLLSDLQSGGSARVALYPHAGDWRAALTVRQAIAFNQPLIAATEPSHNGPAGHSWSFASIDADDVYITALKRAEQTNAYVLRLVEWHGRPAHATVAFGRPVTRVRLANLLEDPAAGVQLARDRRSVTLTLRPWEIVTLLVDQER